MYCILSASRDNVIRVILRITYIIIIIKNARHRNYDL